MLSLPVQVKGHLGKTGRTRRSWEKLQEEGKQKRRAKKVRKGLEHKHGMM